MAYSKENLAMHFNGVGSQGIRTFIYTDTAVESDATLVGAGYFATGVTAGMRKGDLVYVAQTATPKGKQYQVLSVSGAAATVQAVAAIT
jgi:hypothetical protein